MNELMIFDNSQFGTIRAIEKDGEPWFLAVDVCKALEHSNTAMALERLDDDEKYKFSLGLSGGDTWCVNEPGLYSLVLGSRKPEAKAFKRWITHEVIPAIRQTGTYGMVPVTAQRYLTTDDYLRAATITSNCRNERLPYVLGFLEQAGFSIPEIKQDCILPAPENWEKDYQYLCNFVEENSEHFDNKTDPQCIGRIINDYAVIPRPVFNKICEDAGIVHKTILKSMRDYGVLWTSGRGLTRTARIGKRDGICCVWMKLPRDTEN